MLETQVRMFQQLDCLHLRHPDETIAVVGHADPLRAVIAHFLGMPLDLMLRLEISPASVSVVRMGEWAPQVICLNETGEVPA
jgi:probable phosphoglycerate mutase